MSQTVETIRVRHTLTERRLDLLAVLSAVVLMLTAVSYATASHAREVFTKKTGHACNACHTRGYPLTPLGEAFKANKFKLPPCKQITIKLYDSRGVFKETYSGCFPTWGSKVTIGQ